MTLGSACLNLLSVVLPMQPQREGQRRGLTSAVKRMLEVEVDPVAPQVTGQHSCSCLFDRMESLAKRVSAKLEDGDYGWAVRLSCSEDAIADITPNTLSALLQKHPRPHPDSSLPSPPIPISYIPFSEILEDEILSSIRSFPGGPDRIRPQHLLDLTSALAELSGGVLLQSFTNFTNLVLRGEVPQSVKPIFFGANLIHFRKKDSGIRPIAVGQTLRRLVAKCISSRVTHSIRSELAPLQLGCGVSLGCEASAHATCLYLQSMPSNHLLVKLDFRNAFNFVNDAYEHPSFLLCGDLTLESTEGLQQSDPLCPLLFFLTIQLLLMKLQSAFRVFYLDEGTVGGSAEDIIHDLRIVEYEAGLTGLELNHLLFYYYNY